jgi:hypothetical protein
MTYTPGDRAPVQLPPCIICGNPGIVASGWVDRPGERWYCAEHMNQAIVDVGVNTNYPPPVRPYVSSVFPWVVTPHDRRSRHTGERKRRSGASDPWWWQWLRTRGRR